MKDYSPAKLRILVQYHIDKSGGRKLASKYVKSPVF